MERIRNVKVYPWSEREDPKPNKVISISGALIDTTPPGGTEYWRRLATVIDINPDEARSRRELHSGLPGQGRQPLRRCQVLPPARARKPAGGGLLVPEDLRQRHALHGPNPTNDAAHASYAKLKKSADGSFDMYFGPTAPSVQEANWVETVPGRAFYLMYRLYSPTAPLFDGTWALPDAGLT